MSRSTLPHQAGERFLTDGGLETSLIYDQGIDLPAFAAFPLLDTEEGRAAMDRYYRPYLDVAAARGAGFVLETPTWRANPDWGRALGYDEQELERVNRESVDYVRRLVRTSGIQAAVISGAIGPRGDGYLVGETMTVDEAERYHGAQVAAFAAAGADVVTAFTIPYVEEAAGIARAARRAGIPAVIGFTLEIDGHLPSGDTLGDAIERVDAEAPGAVAYFMINCAHPTHFDHALATGARWLGRIGSIRANASTRSHAELDAAEVLDSGDPADLGARYEALGRHLPALVVVGGCCGTDVRHLEAISDAVLPGATAAAA